MMALGLMSGTSLDGVDAAIIETDGHRITASGPTMSQAYPDALRGRIRGRLGQSDSDQNLSQSITDFHLHIIDNLLKENGLTNSNIDIIGFHGQTTDHRPFDGVTVQIGDGARLAKGSGIDVVNQFRLADVKAGGEGAPFAPLYHAALAEPLAKPVTVLNLGGVANVTWIGAENDEDILAFDTGPASALIDDWVHKHTGEAFDRGGDIAASGSVDDQRLARAMTHAYFSKKPPKSLDRNDFVEIAQTLVEGCSLADGAVALTAFTIDSIVAARQFFPEQPKRWLVTGGGRHNVFLMESLARKLEAPVASVGSVGWRGDFLEAEAFAYLAVRSLYGLPLSLPGTTGVAVPTTGGQLHRA